jgi:hypothetical protein
VDRNHAGQLRNDAFLEPMILLEGSQALPFVPLIKSRIKVETLGW